MWLWWKRPWWQFCEMFSSGTNLSGDKSFRLMLFHLFIFTHMNTMCGRWILGRSSYSWKWFALWSLDNISACQMDRVPKPKPPTRNRRLLLVFDNVFEVDISAVFKNNCLRGNIYIRLSFVFSMFSIQSQHFLVDSDAPPPFLCYRKHHQTAMEQRLQRFCLLTFHPSSIFLTHFS